MTLYKINIENRNYISWTTANATTLAPMPLDIQPLDHKLFSNDVFTYNTEKTNKLEIVHSSTRVNDNIAAVLILADNKTYGREQLNSKKDGKLLYKCIPDDTRIPIFLVPYEIKQLGFSKVFANQYVTIRFKEWTTKHPIAIINQLIGPVDVLVNFYEYQLYCKSLNTSIQKFTKATMKAVKEKAEAHDSFITSVCIKYPQIEDRTGWHTFTIDPPTSLDFDDGFSIKTLDNGNYLLSIYIANVTIWLNALNLWSSFSERISTIYLPDRKRPMLPTILSDCLCSLQQNQRRFAFVLDIVVNDSGTILSTHYTNCVIKVAKNFAYEEEQLLKNYYYQSLLSLTKKMVTKYKYISSVKNSHDLVSYLMVLMNYHCAQNMLGFKNGIFRSAIIKKKIVLPRGLPDEVEQFIKFWNSSSGQYLNISDLPTENMDSSIKHDLLDVDAYIHITSPIRRLVDLLNIIQFQKNHNLFPLSKDADEFYGNWIKQMDYINTTVRLIRKVQNDCSLLDTCFNNPDVLDKTYDGYCFDKLVRKDGLYQFTVYLPLLKLVSRIIVRDNLESYEQKQFKLFIFHNEEKFKKKIRLQLLGEA